MLASGDGMFVKDRKKKLQTIESRFYFYLFPPQTRRELPVLCFASDSKRMDLQDLIPLQRAIYPTCTHLALEN